MQKSMLETEWPILHMVLAKQFCLAVKCFLCRFARKSIASGGLLVGSYYRPSPIYRCRNHYFFVETVALGQNIAW